MCVREGYGSERRKSVRMFVREKEKEFELLLEGEKS